MQFQKWHEKLGEISLGHSKVWKIVLWWAFLFKEYNVSVKKLSERLCVMTLEGDTKFKWKLTCGLKNDIRNLVSFHACSRESKNLPFDGLLLSKACRFFDEKEQKCYVSWHPKRTQILKKNWLLISKMTRGVW